ncbi:MAG: GTPase [Candidatus Aenigmatarchaeota archaeon]
MTTKRKVNFWKVVKKVIKKADIILLLLDARFVEETRNKELEHKIKSAKKPLIYVITKADLVSRESLENWKKILKPSVFVSSKKREGRRILKQRIIIEGERHYGKKEKFVVGVLGYPNVGKSSLINYMKGKHSAPTSIISSYTKGMQLIKIDRRIYFIDTPGVIPYKENDEFKHAVTSVKDYTKIKNPDLVVIKIMRMFPGMIESYYNVPLEEDKEKTLEKIAFKKNFIRKGGEADIRRAAVSILKDYQTGKIKINRDNQG